MKEQDKIRMLVTTALMMCMTMVMTFIIRIPIPATQGYIHLGDSMVYLSVILLGWKYGAVAAGVGAAMADLLAGYAQYIPVTFAAKAVMAIIVGIVFKKIVENNIDGTKGLVLKVIAMAVAGVVMVAIYYAAEVVMYGNLVAPLVGVPMNCLQFAVGGVLALAMSKALKGIRVGKTQF